MPIGISFQPKILLNKHHFFSSLRTLNCPSVIQTIVQDQQQHPVWGSYAQRLLDPGAGLWKYPSNGGHDDKAHPPIHPTKFSAGESNWTPDHHVNSLIHNLLPNLFII